MGILFELELEWLLVPTPILQLMNTSILERLPDADDGCTLTMTQERKKKTEVLILFYLKTRNRDWKMIGYDGP